MLRNAVEVKHMENGIRIAEDTEARSWACFVLDYKNALPYLHEANEVWPAAQGKKAKLVLPYVSSIGIALRAYGLVLAGNCTSSK
jgi:hypothetical protein